LFIHSLGSGLPTHRHLSCFFTFYLSPLVSIKGPISPKLAKKMVITMDFNRPQRILGLSDCFEACCGGLK
jgi:hypothetical protein